MRRRALALLVALALAAVVLPLAVRSGGQRGDGAPPPPHGHAEPRAGLEEEAGRPAVQTSATGAPSAGMAAGRRVSPPGQLQQAELRRRIAGAAGLRRRADAGDAEAVRQVAERLAAEPDPRVRQALATGEQPDLGRTRFAPPVLPEPAAAAEAGAVRAYWLTPGSVDGTYESAIAIDAAGRATVETEFEQPDGERWRVRYPAWAYRDGQGRLVIDARGQPVEYLQRPPYGTWSPDSMVIGRDGLIDMIDDKHAPGSGTSGAQGSG